ncbi:hypothetical protein BDV12DRAFT_178473 [Aspergillus spectabilis]
MPHRQCGPGYSQRAYRNCAIGFDDASFPPDEWKEKSVKRIYINTEGERRRVGFAMGCGIGEELDVQCGEGERVFVEGDEE